jgi:hypothetical protein
MAKKKKVREFIAGRCGICNHEYMASDGGWIVNAEHKLFCHHYCFDLYLHNNKIGRLTQTKRRYSYANSR